MSLKTIISSFTTALLVVCTLGLGGPAFAQTTQKQLDIAAARAQRKATVGANMNLTSDEAAKFWPVCSAKSPARMRGLWPSFTMVLAASCMGWPCEWSESNPLPRTLCRRSTCKFGAGQTGSTRRAVVP